MKMLLSVLGVLAAAVLLGVSGLMNYRFGVTLGKTELDGMIYGSASAAADALKALAPFFFVAAVRVRAWGRVAACTLVGFIVTAYSLTSALGHAALNRLDTTGQRAATVQAYKDNRADLARAKEQLSWIPQHRPGPAVQADIDTLKNERRWSMSVGCTDVTTAKSRAFCEQYHGLQAELASAQQSVTLEAKIADIQSKLAGSKGATVMSEADPQAAMIAKVIGLVFSDVKVDDVQMGLTIFIAVLLEIGSGLGFYIALGSVEVRKVAKSVTRDELLAEIKEASRGVSSAPAIEAAPVEVADDDVTEDVPQTAANDDEAVVKQEKAVAPYHKYRPLLTSFLQHNTVSVFAPRAGLSQDELYAKFVDHEERAGRDTSDLSLRVFQYLCADLGVRKQRVRDGQKREIRYAVRPVGEVPVSVAA